MLVKVGDFGLSRNIYAKDYYRSSDKSAKLPVKWLPPETFNDGISNEKTDVVSCPGIAIIIPLKSFAVGEEGLVKVHSDALESSKTTVYVS